MFIDMCLVSFLPTHVLFSYHVFFSMDGPPNSCSPGHRNLVAEKHTVNRLLSLPIHLLAHLQCQCCPLLLGSPALWIPPSAIKHVIPSLFSSSFQQLPILPLADTLLSTSWRKGSASTGPPPLTRADHCPRILSLPHTLHHPLSPPYWVTLVWINMDNNSHLGENTHAFLNSIPF